MKQGWAGAPLGPKTAGGSDTPRVSATCTRRTRTPHTCLSVILQVRTLGCGGVPRCRLHQPCAALDLQPCGVPPGAVRCTSDQQQQQQGCTGKTKGVAGRGRTSSAAQHVSFEQHAGSAEVHDHHFSPATPSRMGAGRWQSAPQLRCQLHAGGRVAAAESVVLSAASSCRLRLLHIVVYTVGDLWSASKSTYPPLANSSNMALPELPQRFGLSFPAPSSTASKPRA